MDILSLNSYSFINVTSYISSTLPLLQDYQFLCYQMCDWASDKNKDD